MRAELLAGHPHAEAAVGRMLGDLAEGCPVRIRPVLLVGPPGAGKSRLCRDVLDALSIPFVPVDAGTTMDHGLTGAARRWHGAHPSVPLRLFAQHKVANPGILVDELEKAGRSSAGAIHDPMLSLLEPLSSRSWREHFLDAEVDASHLVWLCTANSTDGIPGPLLNRLRVVKVHRHPELRDRTVWEVFEAERASLVPYRGRFDGFHGMQAAVSKTCLVRLEVARFV